jgi:inositol transport system permease protein
MSVVIFLGVAAILHVVLRYTRFGKFTYAIGANRQAAVVADQYRQRKNRR